MKILVAGVGSVILRSPARYRRAKMPQTFFPPMDWQPNTDPVVNQIIWPNLNGQIRVYSYDTGRRGDAVIELVDRLSGAFGFGNPVGGWLFNEQVQQFLVDVTLL